MVLPLPALAYVRKPVLPHLARRHAVTFFFGAMALASNVFAFDAPLTLMEAQRRAIERSRQLSSQDFAVSANRETAIAAGQFPDPVLKMGIDNLPVNGLDRFSLNIDFMTKRRVGVMQEITRSDKRRLRSDRFEDAAQNTLAEKTVLPRRSNATPRWHGLTCIKPGRWPQLSESKANSQSSKCSQRRVRIAPDEAIRPSSSHRAAVTKTYSTAG